jgi:hypothetical protein
MYFFLFIALFSFIYLPIVNVSATSPYRYYAGYFYSGTQTSAPLGVKGDIYACNTGIPPFDEFVAEYVDIKISYTRNYWVQVGYIIHWTWIWILFIPIPIAKVDFYIEQKDSNGHGMWYLSWPHVPLFGHTYTYQLIKTDANEYTYFIFDFGTIIIYSGVMYLDPDNPCDLRAFVETSHTGIIISGSHFSQLRYRQTSTNWPLWNKHIRYATGGYWLDYNDLHYEFYAYGGG